MIHERGSGRDDSGSDLGNLDSDVRGGELLHPGTMSVARPTTGDMKTSMTKLQISSQRKRDSARNLGTARVLWMTQGRLTSPPSDRLR